MPSKHTFTIKPIAELLARWLVDRPECADAFAGFNSPAKYTNDLNPSAPTRWHLEAQLFAAEFRDQGLDAFLLDPPYSPRQISECYKSIGLKVGMAETQSAAMYARVRDAFTPKLKTGGGRVFVRLEQRWLWEESRFRAERNSAGRAWRRTQRHDLCGRGTG